MRIGIMQPYFFPYVGYFSLIRATDFWSVFDDVQFIRHGWIERNRMLNSKNEWHYIRVPLVKGPRSQSIKDTLIRKDEPWQEMMLAQLTCYKKKAPYYDATIDLLRQVILHPWEDISSLNVAAMKAVCDYVGMPFRYELFSKANVSIPQGEINAGEWALHIAKHYNASVYINPTGGMDLFDPAQYAANGIEIKFLKNNLVPYIQRIGRFEAGLSILDVLMFNSPEETLRLIDDYQFV